MAPKWKVIEFLAILGSHQKAILEFIGEEKIIAPKFSFLWRIFFLIRFCNILFIFPLWGDDDNVYFAGVYSASLDNCAIFFLREGIV